MVRKMGGSALHPRRVRDPQRETGTHRCEMVAPRGDDLVIYVRSGGTMTVTHPAGTNTRFHAFTSALAARDVDALTATLAPMRCSTPPSPTCPSRAATSLRTCTRACSPASRSCGSPPLHQGGHHRLLLGGVHGGPLRRGRRPRPAQPRGQGGRTSRSSAGRCTACPLSSRSSDRLRAPPPRGTRTQEPCASRPFPCPTSSGRSTRDALAFGEPLALARAARSRARESKMGDPGLEPGTSSLSERRSDRLS